MENWDYEQEMMHRQFQGYVICELCRLRDVSKKFLLIYMNIKVILLLLWLVLLKLYLLNYFTLFHDKKLIKITP